MSDITNAARRVVDAERDFQASIEAHVGIFNIHAHTKLARLQQACGDLRKALAEPASDVGSEKAGNPDPEPAQKPAVDNRYRDLILWALGEGNSNFPPRKDGDHPYYWRGELRRRLNAIDHDAAPKPEPKPAEPAPPAGDWRERAHSTRR